MYIAEWEWDDANVEHMGRHGVTPSDIEAVWHGDPKFRKNKRGRAASHQMIGRDGRGRFIAAFIQAIRPSEGRWRIVTARQATATESNWWELS